MQRHDVILLKSLWNKLTGGPARRRRGRTRSRGRARTPSAAARTVHERAQLVSSEPWPPSDAPSTMAGRPPHFSFQLYDIDQTQQITYNPPKKNLVSAKTSKCRMVHKRQIEGFYKSFHCFRSIAINIYFLDFFQLERLFLPRHFLHHPTQLLCILFQLFS